MKLNATMKININKRTEGSALVVTLLTALVIGITLASYLTLVSNQNQSVARSLAWNTAMTVSEAGAEEGLLAVNYKGISNLTSVGWTFTGSTYTKERTLPDGSRYSVTIQPTTPPTILSSGSTILPLTPSSAYGMIFGAAQSASPRFISRTVMAKTTNVSIFLKSLVVKKGINANGNSFSADAFDSSDPAYSTLGQYDKTKAADGGGVATASTLANQLNFGSATVKAHVSTGPGGSINTPAWRIGDTAWLASHPGSGQIEPGFFTTDFNATFPDVPVPFTAGYTVPIGGTVAGNTVGGNGGTNFSYVMGSGKYQISSGNFGGKVYVSGDAVLYVTSGATVNFNTTLDSIFIAPGASLQLYVGSATVNLPNVVNDTTPDKFVYYGLPTNTAINQQVNADFIGTVYAPNAKYTLGGNGSGAEQKIIGASITDSVSYNDLFSFHYDLNLLKVGPARGFLVSSWNEL
jgi:hypothetical protein